MKNEQDRHRFGPKCALTNEPCEWEIAKGKHPCTQCNVPIIKKLEELRPG